MTERNADLREVIRTSGIKMYQVSERLGIAESTFYRWLRTSLPKEKREEIIEIIRDLAFENLAKFHKHHEER